MNKSLISMALIASAGTAAAQSSVTLFGVVDVTARYGQASGPGSINRTQLGSGGNAASRLGLRGTEDLGGGLAASFWLEGTILVDTGNGYPSNSNNQTTGFPASTAGAGFAFDRRSTVSLTGNWGELRFGRDFTPQFWNIAIDPFGVSGVGITLTMPKTSASAAGLVPGTTSTALRASNGIAYFLSNNLGGVYGQATYYLGENPRNGSATADDGQGYGVRLGYKFASADVAVATSRTSYATGDARQTNVGARYNLDRLRLMGHYARDGLGTVKGRGWLLGAVVPVGPHEFKVSYSRYTTDSGTFADPRAGKLAIGYVNNLSKRTLVYATWATVRNSNGSAVTLNQAVAGGPDRSSSGVDLGMLHRF